MLQYGSGVALFPEKRTEDLVINLGPNFYLLAEIKLRITVLISGNVNGKRQIAMSGLSPDDTIELIHFSYFLILYKLQE